MQRDMNLFTTNSPQFHQPDQLSQTMKGIIVDVRDPSMNGRVRVWSYGLYGDAAGLDVYSIPWAEVPMSVRGSHTPPEIFDRCYFTFEAGDRYSPIVLSYWKGNPAGRGQLPHNSGTGSEVRPEAWASHDLYPEVLLLAASGIGNAIWMESKVLNDSNVASVIQLEDTGGRVFKTKSYHQDSQAWMVEDNIPDGIGTLQGGFGQAGQPIRDGLSSPDPASGTVEYGSDAINHWETTDAQDFSNLQTTQAGGMTEQSVPAVYRFQGGGAEYDMVAGGMTIPTGVSFNFTQTPKRWDGS